MRNPPIPSRLKEAMKRVHDEPCKNCPSIRPLDPEALDMIRWFKDGKISVTQAIFPCAWRPEKYCKGVCDNMGLSELDVVMREGYEAHIKSLGRALSAVNSHSFFTHLVQEYQANNYEFNQIKLGVESVLKKIEDRRR